jgi:hypothetical protein
MLSDCAVGPWSTEREQETDPIISHGSCLSTNPGRQACVGQNVLNCALRGAKDFGRFTSGKTFINRGLNEYCTAGGPLHKIGLGLLADLAGQETAPVLDEIVPLPLRRFHAMM